LPTVTFFTTLFVLPSMTDTVSERELATYTMLVVGLTATPCGDLPSYTMFVIGLTAKLLGDLPTCTSPTTLFVLPSITETVLER